MIKLPGSRRGAAVYPAVGAFLVGTLVAGLLFRLNVDRPANGEALSAGAGTGGGSVVGGTTGTSDSIGGSGATGGTGGSAPGTAGQVGGTMGPGSVGQGPGSSTGGGATGSTGAGQVASDVGVTATQIKIGIVLLACSSCNSLAASSGGNNWGPDQDRGVWQAWVDHINKTGGIYGRKIVPYYHTVDVQSEDQARAACTSWTETEKVFLVIGRDAMQAAGDLCVAVQHRTLMLTGPQPKDPAQFYAQSHNLLISAATNGTRSMRNWARSVNHYGDVKGRKIGILMEQGFTEQLVREGLLPELKRLGNTVVYTATISKDIGAGQQQAASQASSFFQNGVDDVMFAVNPLSIVSFVQQADKIATWHPRWEVNDAIGGNIAVFYSGMPSSWDGANLILSNGYEKPESPWLKQCRLDYNKFTGHHVFSPAYDPNNGSATPNSASTRNAQEWSLVNEGCNDFNLIKTVAGVLKTNLTRTGFASVVQTLGSSVQMGNANVIGGSFGPGKTDWMDGLRKQIWGPKQNGSTNCGENGECFNDTGTPYDPEKG